MITLRGGRCYRRTAASLPDEHPDSWVTLRQPDQRALDTSRHVGSGSVAGRAVLFFVDADDRRWAQPLTARGWDEGLGAPTNYDPEQEKNH